MNLPPSSLSMSVADVWSSSGSDGPYDGQYFSRFRGTNRLRSSASSGFRQLHRRFLKRQRRPSISMIAAILVLSADLHDDVLGLGDVGLGVNLGDARADSVPEDRLSNVDAV